MGTNGAPARFKRGPGESLIAAEIRSAREREEELKRSRSELGLPTLEVSSETEKMGLCDDDKVGMTIGQGEGIVGQGEEEDEAADQEKETAGVMRARSRGGDHPPGRGERRPEDGFHRRSRPEKQRPD